MVKGKKNFIAGFACAALLGSSFLGLSGAQAAPSVLPPKNQLGITGTKADLRPITDFCGTKKSITVALADGFGGNSWRKITRAAFENEAKKCKNIKKIIYTDANNDPAKAIADMNSLIARRVNVIITFVDSGPALLPTIKKATKAGIAVVPYVAGPGGTPGVDYVAQVGENIGTYGSALADWTIKAMGGKGNLLMLGGTAGNGYSQGVYDGVLAAVKKNPNVILLNADGFLATNWEPGMTQQVVAGAITKYGKIDGIVSDYGGGSVGGIRAFIAANKALPVWSANDSNEFACNYYTYNKTQPQFQVATMSSRNWISAAALHRGLAAYNRIVNKEPTTFNLTIIEDSTNPKLMPKCDPTLPPDAILSAGLSATQLKKLFGK
jgi:ribose transport system substrate-binding protein